MGGNGRTVAVTGATGFVGQALCDRLVRDGWHVIALTRTKSAALPPQVEVRAVGDLAAVEDFAPFVSGADMVVHLAAKVHVMAPTAEDTAAFQAVNVDTSRRLAEGAARAGARRLLFVSSIKVNGESTPPASPFTADASPHPGDDYGRSKAAAEAALRSVSAQTGLEVTILRPPVVYGPGVKANVAALARLCASPIPLPFGAARNARSLIAVDNLVDAILSALVSPRAAGRTFLVRDGEDVSTGELVRRIRRAQGRPARLLPVPQGLMTTALHLLGRRPHARDPGLDPSADTRPGARPYASALSGPEPAVSRHRGLVFLVAPAGRGPRGAGCRVAGSRRLPGHGARTAHRG
jgi:nucleoside-diphosphate-sugar epimerase